MRAASASSAASSARSSPPLLFDEASEHKEDEDEDGQQDHSRVRKTVRWTLPSPPESPGGAFVDLPSPREEDATVQEEPSIWHRRYAGLIVSVAMASLLTSWLKRGVLTLMKRELHLRAYQQDAAEILLMLPWSCSFLIGFLSDVFPIRGSRWKAYMVVGWVFASTGLLGMSVLEHAKGGGPATDHVVSLYVFLLGLTCFGEIMTIIIAEAFVVALSKRQQLATRGQIVAAFLLLQLLCEAIGQLGVYELLWAHRVDSFTLRVMTHALFVYSLVPIPVLLWWFNDHLEDESFDSSSIEAAEETVKVLSICESPIHTNRTASTEMSTMRSPDTQWTARYAVGGDDIATTQRTMRSPFGSGTTMSLTTNGSNLPSSISLRVESDDEFDTDVSIMNNDTDISLTDSTSKPVKLIKQFVLHVKDHWLVLWRTLQTRATWNVFRFLCLYIFFSEFALKYAHLVLDDWSDVTGITDAETDMVAEFMYVVAILVFRFVFLNRNWKVLACIALFLVYLLPQLVYYTLVIFVPALRGGATGSTLIYSLVKSMRGFLRGTVLVLEIMGIVEIAPRGAEGVVLGTLASVATIMRLVAATFSNMVGYLFGSQVLLARTVGKVSSGSTNFSGSGSNAETYKYDYEADEPWIVFTALMLCLGIRLLAGTGVLCLPKDKWTLSAMAGNGFELSGVKPPTSRLYPWLVLVILAASIIVATTFNSFAVSPGTWCLRAFGGKGCN